MPCVVQLIVSFSAFLLPYAGRWLTMKLAENGILALLMKIAICTARQSYVLVRTHVDALTTHQLPAMQSYSLPPSLTCSLVAIIPICRVCPGLGRSRALCAAAGTNEAPTRV